MASLFSGRRRRSAEDDDGSGSGRAKRRRVSPEEGARSPDAAEGAEGWNPGWLSTVLSGAKRVLSSVLFSSSEEQTSEGEEEEEEEGSEADADGNEDTHNSDEAIVPYSESKLAIEEMVMKESFSRDECDKMVKLLQSRVTGSMSPGSPLQASPEQVDAAVMEAKRWLEEKRQGVGTKAEYHGPCSLNTDMLNSPVEDDKGSRVDVAKSYMQSLSPRQSPLLGNRKFKTSPSGGVHINVYERKSKLFLSAKGVVDSLDLAPKDCDNLVQECHPASEVHRDETPQGNHMPLTSATKDIVDHSADVKSVPAVPEIHEESHVHSTSDSRPKDAAPQIEDSLRSLRKEVRALLSTSRVVPRNRVEAVRAAGAPPTGP